MSKNKIPQLAPTIFVTALIASCANPKHVDEAPIAVMRNGDRIAAPTRALDAATTQAREMEAAGREKRDSLTAVAFANCTAAVCAALGRGELAIGMNEAQVYAATHTTDVAWSARRSGGSTILTPRDREAAPRDAVGPLALIQIAGGAVSSMTYREPHGLRMVATPSDATYAGKARANALVREGDAFAAAGDFTAALDRYDRASVITRDDAELTYKMAAAADKLLLPQEAEVRYKMFLEQLELQKIEATGAANAKLAEAMMQARERIVVLDRQQH